MLSGWVRRGDIVELRRRGGGRLHCFDTILRWSLPGRLLWRSSSRMRERLRLPDVLHARCDRA